MTTQNHGKLGSLIIMILAIVFALVGEYWAYEYVGDNLSEWYDYCDDDTCFQFSAVYRISFATTCFFALMAMTTAAVPESHDWGWCLKSTFWFLLCVGSVFLPNDVMTSGFIWFARVGAFVFLVLQQVILIDFGYNVNDKLYSLGAEGGEEEGGCSGWFIILVSAAMILYGAALSGIVLLFVFYTGCDVNDALISVSLVCIVAFTVLQLCSDPEQGHNLLVSSIVAAYVAYLTYSSVSSNPDESCNPTYSDRDDALAITLGLSLTMLSIATTVYFSSASITQLLDESPASSKGPARMTADLLTNDGMAPAQVTTSSSPRPSDQLVIHRGLAWKFNVVLVLITMYWCMTLTNWGDSGGDSSGSSPMAGKISLWMNITASWISIALYTWTMVAPWIFPDRDFS